MQNNFERAVQQKMDELNLTPSAPVWQKVEMEIAVKKRRRRGIFWLALAALLLAGGWWLYPFPKTVEKQHKQTTKSSQVLPNRNETQTSPSDKKKNEIADKESNSSRGKTGVSNELTPHESNDTSSTASFGTSKQTASLAPTRNNASSKPFLNNVEKNKVADFDKSKAPMHQHNKGQRKTETADMNKELATKTSMQKSKPTTQNVSAPDLSNPTPQLSGDSSHSSPVTTPAQTIVESTVNKIDSTQKEQPTKEKASAKTDTAFKRKIAAARWRSSFTINAGWSDYAASSSQSSLSAFANYSSPPATGVTPAAPSATRKGLHFSIGFSRAKKFGKHWELAGGVQYTYASVYTKVGDKKPNNVAVRFLADSVGANGYYANTGTTDYTTRFHFIEVPVSVSFKPSLRLPLYLLAGAAYGRLLSSNALTFSEPSNIYYQNKQNYLRNTLPVFSAVQVGLFERKKLSLRTGPFLQYDLLKLRKENIDGVPHFFFAGLKTAINF